MYFLVILTRKKTGYGAKIRAKSPAIRNIREDQERIERRAARAQRRKERMHQKSAVNTVEPATKEETV